jgi:hypothetical protein
MFSIFWVSFRVRAFKVVVQYCYYSLLKFWFGHSCAVPASLPNCTKTDVIKHTMRVMGA